MLVEVNTAVANLEQNRT